MHTNNCNPSSETCYHDWIETGTDTHWVSDKSGTGYYMTRSIYTATGTLCGEVSTAHDEFEKHSSWVENIGLQQSNWSHSYTIYECGYEEGSIESATIKINN